MERFIFIFQFGASQCGRWWCSSGLACTAPPPSSAASSSPTTSRPPRPLCAITIIIPIHHNIAAQRVLFVSDVFHPAVHPVTRELNLTAQFPTWRCCTCMHWTHSHPSQARGGQAVARGGLCATHLLQAGASGVRLHHSICRGHTHARQDFLSNEAAGLHQTRPEVFALRVQECIRACDVNVYTTPDDDFDIVYVRRPQSRPLSRPLFCTGSQSSSRSTRRRSGHTSPRSVCPVQMT